ncbi:GntR family transcriptional regulator [Luteimonas suaedae]|uniref:GntR family transcriptional regulator n=1 Tax=Luteimonas suaedae TaxID=2605430 RepID=UPI0011ED1FB1|nr:GntR family transcriptional regulator [Luteimonas suaedae]
MSAFHTKSVQLQDQVRRALRSGRYLPGDRIDPASLAAEFNTSLMPARLALERLVGEGLLEHHSRGGVYLPLPTEVELRDAYDWMQRLLLMACDIGIATRLSGGVRQPDVASANEDPVEMTWQLFDAIGHATAHTFVHDEIGRMNGRLAPIRRAKRGLIDGAFEEIIELNRHWQQRDMPSLKVALRHYHERRKQLVPCIVVTLKQRHDRLQ